MLIQSTMSGDSHSNPTEHECPECNSELISQQEPFKGKAKLLHNYDDVADKLREQGVVSNDALGNPVITESIRGTETWCSNNDCDYYQRTHQPADASVFESPFLTEDDEEWIDMNENDLLGEHTFENVLYTGDVPDLPDIPLVMPSQRMDSDVKRAKRITVLCDGERVLIPLPDGMDGDTPYRVVPFFHMAVTNCKFETVLEAACESSAYSVAYTPDYDTGDIVITVNRSESISPGF